MKYTNKYSLPPSLVDVINNKTYDLSSSDPKRISITTLINPPIQRLLTVRHWNELEEDVSDHIWRITGNAYHYILATTNKEDRFIEEKLTEEVDGFTIVGKLDLYEKKTKSIEDYKVTSVWNVKLGTKEEWEKQLNCYAWLLRKAKFEVTSAYVNAILRDWRKKEVMRYDDYPKIPFVRIQAKLWSFEEQQKFVEERIKLYREVMNLQDNELTVCSDTERWSKPSVWAVYKGTNKKAEKLCSSNEEALEFASKMKFKSRIEQRPATNGKCEDYCLVNSFCPFYNKNYDIKTGQLKCKIEK